MIRKLMLVTSATAAILLGGCSAATQPARKTTELSGSRVKDYATFAALKKESSAIVRVSAGDSRVDDLNGVPVTVTTVTVLRALSGAVPSNKLAVQQMGDASMSLPDSSSILLKGREYLLFVTPFRLTPSDDTGRFIVTGDQGIYLRNEAAPGQGARAQFVFAGAGQAPSQAMSLPAADVDSLRFMR
ncbi:hypothetical protein ABTX15_32080 [Micromonospora sp. NPDC094482]|uniref:hypothetical protein n=1 Tax=unclassified Micromonospora TaxID=2617518 RepID=UPI0033214A6C